MAAGHTNPKKHVVFCRLAAYPESAIQPRKAGCPRDTLSLKRRVGGMRATMGTKTPGTNCVARHGRNQNQGEPRRKGASKRRQAIGPAVRPGFMGHGNERQRCGTRNLCRSFGPRILCSHHHALTGAATYCRRFAPTCSASCGKNILVFLQGTWGQVVQTKGMIVWRMSICNSLIRAQESR